MSLLLPKGLNNYIEDESELGFVFPFYDEDDSRILGNETLSVQEELENHIEEGLRDAKFGYFFFGAFEYTSERAMELIRKVLIAFTKVGYSDLKIVLHESCAFEQGMGQIGISISIYCPDYKIKRPGGGQPLMAIYRLTLIRDETGYQGIHREASIVKSKILSSIRSLIQEGYIDMPKFYYKDNDDSPSTPI